MSTNGKIGVGLPCRTQVFPETIPQASSSLSYVDLVAGTTLDNVYHVLAYTGVPRSDGDASPGVLIVGEALVWVQVLHRDRPQGNVPRSSPETEMVFRWLLTKESRRLVSRRYEHKIRTGS